MLGCDLKVNLAFASHVEGCGLATTEAIAEACQFRAARLRGDVEDLGISGDFEESAEKVILESRLGKSYSDQWKDCALRVGRAHADLRLSSMVEAEDLVFALSFVPDKVPRVVPKRLRDAEEELAIDRSHVEGESTHRRL